MRRKVVLITGASSGIGYELALEFGRSKYKVWAASRQPARLSKLRKQAKEEGLLIEYLKLDLTKQDLIDRAYRKIIKKDKKIDILINNAGYGLVGSVEDTPVAEIKLLFEVNFFGAYHLTRLVLPLMRRRKRGVIVNIGSIAGRFGWAGTSGYNASKWALEAFSESLYLELAAFKIKVILVEPGVVKTNFNKNRVEIWRNLTRTAYKFVYLRHKKRRFGKKFVLSPSSLAKQVVELVEDEDPPLRQTAGWDAKIMLLARNWLPERVILRLMRPK